MNTLIIKAQNINETDKIAEIIAKSVEASGGLVCLYGDIGAGKTTLVKSIAKYLDIKEKVTSPSFVILNEYHSGKISLYHFDLYRLEKEGIKSILDELREYSASQNTVTFIEWAEFSLGELSDFDRLEIQIVYIDENSRNFLFKAEGQKSKELLERIKYEYFNN